MHSYLALLRGVNVGGNGLIKMAELQDSLLKVGLLNVHTYIQSGNVFFSSSSSNKKELAEIIKSVIKQDLGLDVEIAIFSKQEWTDVIRNAPKSWGVNANWKHNLFILIKPFTKKEIIDAVGELKPEIESLDEGRGVFYQSVSLEKFGRSIAGKFISTPYYKQMTVRNYNTSIKLLALFD